MKIKTNKHDETQFQEHLGYLKLTSIRENYEPEAKTAVEKHLSHVEYLARLVEGEAALRRDRSILRRIKMARFPVIKALDEFDWSWPKKINRLQVQNLFRLSFIEENANVVMVGAMSAFLPMDAEVYENIINTRIPERFREVNLKAFAAGRKITA